MTSVLIPEWPAPAGLVAGTTTRLATDGDLPPGIRFLNQVHGPDVVTIDALRHAPAPLDADAVTGRAPGDVCAVRTADCLPVLFCSLDGRRIGAAHAGWRGLAAGVLENAVDALGVAPAELLAWFGPAISQANFEVGDEVREAFVAPDAGASDCFVQNARGRWQADLYRLARRRLAACGVTAIHGGGWCTYGDPSRFHSYRRDPDCGRMVSFIAIPA